MKRKKTYISVCAGLFEIIQGFTEMLEITRKAPSAARGCKWKPRARQHAAESDYGEAVRRENHCTDAEYDVCVDSEGLR